MPAITRIAAGCRVDGPASALPRLHRRGGDLPVRPRERRLQGPREDLRHRRARRRSAADLAQVRAVAGGAAARRPSGDHARLPPQQAPLEHGRGRRQRAGAARARHGRGLLRPRRERASTARTRGSRLVMTTTVLVTGATDGLGRAVARDLTARGAAVLVHGRDERRVAEVAEEIGAERTFLADFSSLAAVRALADGLPELDVLVNNAGLISEERVVTGDGHELTFQVNYLAPFLLTTRYLERHAPRRIVNVASIGQQRPDFGDLMPERGYEPWRAYRQSKLAQIMFAFELAARRPDVESTALHPATFMGTKIVRSRGAPPMNPIQTGADATVRLAVDFRIDVSGRFFDVQSEARPDAIAYDREARKRLWDVSERLVARAA